MKLKSEVLRMMQERPALRVWLTAVAADETASFDDLARRAGLAPLGRGWTEVDGARVRRFLTGVLHRDLAYGTEVMPEHRAAWLADEFISAAGEYGSRYATNSPDMPHESSFSWTAATDYSFDAGVAVIGIAGSALFWVADED